MTLREGELEFDFSGSVSANRFDPLAAPAPGDPPPIGLKAVDFVVEEHDRVLLVEVKDPACSQIVLRERAAMAKDYGTRGLVQNDLVPKCRDTFTYLHLMERDRKPIFYIVLVAFPNGMWEVALKQNLKQTLLRRIRQETDKPWKRKYIRDCFVFTLADWRANLPYNVKRIP